MQIILSFNILLNFVNILEYIIDKIYETKKTATIYITSKNLMSQLYKLYLNIIGLMISITHACIKYIKKVFVDIFVKLFLILSNEKPKNKRTDDMQIKGEKLSIDTNNFFGIKILT